MVMKYSLAVFVGRFQPFHVGHLHNINQALLIADKLVIIVGSSFRASSIKNPFSFDQRKQMILSDLALVGIDLNRVAIEPVSDWFYDENGWINEVSSAVLKHADNQDKIAIVGHQKDASSYYLKCFPSWQHVDVDNYCAFNATDFRKKLFKDVLINPEYMVSKDQSQGSYYWLTKFIQSSEFRALKHEYDVIESYHKSWELAPFAPMFVTTDAMLIVNGYLLLIKRKDAPGKDLWALPGGFLEQDERVIDGVMRELFEETQVGLPQSRLQESLVATEVFDYPGRSERGRVITHLGLFAIDNTGNYLPTVKADDDAKEAKWFLLEQVLEHMSSQLMDDHYQIIRYISHHYRIDMAFK